MQNLTLMVSIFSRLKALGEHGAFNGFIRFGVLSMSFFICCQHFWALITSLIVKMATFTYRHLLAWSQKWLYVFIPVFRIIIFIITEWICSFYLLGVNKVSPFVFCMIGFHTFAYTMQSRLHVGGYLEMGNKF